MWNYNITTFKYTVLLWQQSADKKKTSKDANGICFTNLNRLMMFMWLREIYQTHTYTLNHLLRGIEQGNQVQLIELIDDLVAIECSTWSCRDKNEALSLFVLSVVIYSVKMNDNGRQKLCFSYGMWFISVQVFWQRNWHALALAHINHFFFIFCCCSLFFYCDTIDIGVYYPIQNMNIKIEKKMKTKTSSSLIDFAYKSIKRQTAAIHNVPIVWHRMVYWKRNQNINWKKNSDTTHMCLYCCMGFRWIPSLHPL